MTALGRFRGPVDIRPPLLMRIYTVGFTIFWCGTLLSWSREDPIALLMVLFGATLGYRLVRMGVRGDESGLLVRNGIRTKRYAWSEVEHFDVPKRPGRLFRGVSAILRSGKRIELEITRGRGVTPGGARKLEAQIEALDRWISH